MANPEHLEILEQGVEVWNKCRIEHPTIKPDPSHADLFRHNPEGFNFENANSFGTDCIAAELKGANFKQAVVKKERHG